MNTLDTRTAEGSWTVFVYIAADNELSTSAKKSLENIKAGGSSASVRTVVQIDEGKDVGAARYVGENGTFNKEKELGEIDTGNPKPLIDFLKWGISRCPASKYLWVLWGHGAGLDGRTPGFTPGGSAAECLSAGTPRAPSDEGDSSLFDLSNGPIEEILHDYTTEHYLSNTCLRFALEEVGKSTGRKASILGLDACLMGMIEIVCDFRNGAHFIVASEDTEPRASWPYREIVSELVSAPDTNPRDLGKQIVSEYMKSFPASERQKGLTLSLCNLEESSAIVTAVRNLSRVLRDFVRAGRRAAIERARADAPRFDRDYVDLEGFCQALSEQQENKDVATCSHAVIAALKNDFVVYSESEGRNVSHSKGISIFIPTIGSKRLKRLVGPRSGKVLSRLASRAAGVPKAVLLIRSSYQQLPFVKETEWDLFLLSYLGFDEDSASGNKQEGGNMSVEPVTDSGDRKKPTGPHKKPRRKTGRKKPDGPKKKPHAPGKKRKK